MPLAHSRRLTFRQTPKGGEGSTLMSILGRIVSSIFGHASAAPASGTAAAPGSPAKPAASAPSSSAAPASTAKPGTPVDVTSILDKLAASNKEKLDWRHSIVDLMKLLNLDSSLAARKELAEELHFTGDKNDFGVDEYLAPQAGHGEACGERRQSAGRIAEITTDLPVSGTNKQTNFPVPGRKPLAGRNSFD